MSDKSTLQLLFYPLKSFLSFENTIVFFLLIFVIYYKKAISFFLDPITFKHIQTSAVPWESSPFQPADAAATWLSRRLLSDRFLQNPPGRLRPGGVWTHTKPEQYTKETDHFDIVEENLRWKSMRRNSRRRTLYGPCSYRHEIRLMKIQMYTFKHVILISGIFFQIFSPLRSTKSNDFRSVCVTFQLACS